jgi:hypothetical protein
MSKGRHFDHSAVCAGILRDLWELMAVRGISIDHSTIHR